MTTITSTNPATPETLKSKQTALELVRAERAKVAKQLPQLSAAVKTASERLEKAKLDVFVAKGTPGFEDDAAAEASVAKARKDLDALCTQRDAADDRLDFLGRAEKQLQGEVEKRQGALHLQHVARARKGLEARIAAKAPVLATLIAEIAALRSLDGRTTWPQELDSALEDALAPEDRHARITQPLAAALRAGMAMADRVRAGAAVEEVGR